MTKVRDGTLYLLLDNQTYVPERQKQQRYTRLVMQALNQSGVDYISQLNLDFDPSYEKLTLHTLSILREGNASINFQLQGYRLSKANLTS